MRNTHFRLPTETEPIPKCRRGDSDRLAGKSKKRNGLWKLNTELLPNGGFRRQSSHSTNNDHCNVMMGCITGVGHNRTFNSIRKQPRRSRLILKNIATYGAGAQQVTKTSLKQPATSSLIPNGPAGVVGPAERIFPKYPSLQSPHDKLRSKSMGCTQPRANRGGITRDSHGVFITSTSVHIRASLPGNALLQISCILFIP